MCKFLKKCPEFLVQLNSGVYGEQAVLVTVHALIPDNTPLLEL